MPRPLLYRVRSTPRALFVCLSLAFLPWLLVTTAVAQTWETAANNPSDPKFVQMPYEVVFVSSPIIETGTCTWTDAGGVQHTEPRGVYDIGTDVLAATKPSQGNQLWVVTRNGTVKLLFPLPVHLTQTATHPDTGLPVPLIDTPNGMLEVGSVVEPNVSEDGERIIFGYYHDTTFHVGSGQGKLAKQGADLYTLDISAMVQAANPDLIDPATLPVRRLTFKEYDGSGAQSDADKHKEAQNPTVAMAPAGNGKNGWGNVNIHGTEMRTQHGLKMVYVSGDRRNMNSNQAMSDANYNLNLVLADIEADGSLGAHRQFHYYTTTSALSPTPLRNGIAFSYQATTEDGRNWHIQHSDSEGRWGPLIGYGTNPDLFHLGAFCVDTQGDAQGNGPGDYFIATKYYNLNNNGFGALWKIDMDQLGLNTNDNYSSWGKKPAQVSSRKISLNVEDRDFPSAKDPSTHQYYGKLTTPRCGRPDELFFAYTPTSANSKSATCEPNEGNGIYHSYIGFRPNLGDFDPLTDIFTLVDDSSDVLTLTWAVPVLSHFERTGDAQQQVGNSIIGRRSVVTPGEPFAQVGTSAIYNTDRKPYDCWLGPLSGGGCSVQQGAQTYHLYNPNKLKNNQKEQIWANFDALTLVQDPNDFCKDLSGEGVLGIAVNITSNRVDHSNTLGYQTDGGGKKETVRLLGVYDVRQQADQSFQAMIPSHTPFEFHLLENKYGLRVVDVRSWHSLQPREVRTNCGGCHGHEVGQGQPFQGTVAASQPPLDMVNQTQSVTYDAQCRVRLAVDTTKATQEMPEWKADIYPQFDQYCGPCHNSNVSTDPLALGVLSYSNELGAYNELKSKHFANSRSGALGSPAFWAARGERTDGRDNSLYQSGALCDSTPTFAHSSGHASNPNLCGQNNLAMAQWVHRLGQWIDNHLPRDTGSVYDANFDRYHPAMDIAAIDGLCQASKLRVGYWDDSGFLSKVEVLRNGLPLVAPVLNVANGSHILNGLSLSNGDRIKVIGEDAAGNRQMYEKKVKEIKDDCQPQHVVVVPGPAQPLP